MSSTPVEVLVLADTGTILMNKCTQRKAESVSYDADRLVHLVMSLGAHIFRL